MRLRYEEARSAVELAERLDRPDRIVRTDELLILRSRAAGRGRARLAADAAAPGADR